ncbi:MAG TPA: hypothetical protein VKS01_05430, partial [Bryobacteraceae bacterium]|nr:hypothetical protein [Bryobacteraceae bacterium]
MAAQTTINLSHDLVPLGIADQNMTPDTPALDSQPLFLAALNYIQNNPVELLTADPGAYYFVSTFPSNSAVYLYFPPLANLTIDFQGSTLYFHDGYRRGFDIELCQNLRIENFTIDYLAPAYTQVQLTSINANAGSFTYTPLAGWADPNTFVTTPEFGDPRLLGVFFRNGVQVAATGLTFFNYPISGKTLTVSSSDIAPWTQSNVFATLQAGDVLVVVNANGADPIDVSKCDSLLFTNIEIHGGLGAINLFNTSNTTLDHIRVVPRPGALLGSG